MANRGSGRVVRRHGEAGECLDSTIRVGCSGRLLGSLFRSISAARPAVVVEDHVIEEVLGGKKRWALWHRVACMTFES